MDVYFMDKNFNAIDIVDYQNSIIWTKRYYTVGDFEIVLPACKKTMNIAKKAVYVYRLDDDAVMIIKRVQLQTDADNGDKLIISGVDAKEILNRRIVWQQTNINTTLEKGITKLLNENAIMPELSERKINNLSIGSLCSKSATLQLVKQVTGKPLGDTLTDICMTYGLGHKVTMNSNHNKFIYSLYSGVDRSYAQTKNSYVVFSDEYGNLLTSDYTKDESNYKNVAMVAGEGEGKARKKSIVGNAAGLDRYEIFVDKRDLSTNDGEISNTEYLRQLTEEGQTALAEYEKTEEFESELDTYTNFIYGVDYFLGDIVQIENGYGLQERARITEIIESEDESGHVFIPTFERIAE